MAHGFVSGDRDTRAKEWREIEARNRREAREASTKVWGESFNPQGIVSGHTRMAEQARELAERYEQG